MLTATKVRAVLKGAARVILSKSSGRSSLASLQVPAFNIVDALQKHDPEIQVEATALAFVTLTAALGIDPHELVSRAKRQHADSLRLDNGDLEAIADYAQGELR